MSPVREICRKINPTHINRGFIRQASCVLRRGGLVVFPTETVYGLGADAFNKQAIAKIFLVKQRPSDNPLIAHIARLNDLKKLARNVPPQAFLLAKRFWPGPLTLILSKKPTVPKIVTGQTNTIAVRMPDHPVALALIKKAGCPIAAPSANLAGRPSATNITHALSDFGRAVDLYLDTGPSKIGLESTVLDLTVNPPEILRPGAITKKALQKLLGRVVEREYHHGSAVRSPGMKYRHYAPNAQLILVTGNKQTMIKKIQLLITKYTKDKKKIGVIASKETAKYYHGTDHTTNHIIVIGSRKNLKEIANNLFRVLRQFNAQGVDIIIAETFPEDGIGKALMNRLRKAASKLK